MKIRITIDRAEIPGSTI